MSFTAAERRQARLIFPCRYRRTICLKCSIYRRSLASPSPLAGEICLSIAHNSAAPLLAWPLIRATLAIPRTIEIIHMLADRRRPSRRRVDARYFHAFTAL